MRIGVDLMGGDGSPSVVLAAAIDAARALQGSATLLLLGASSVVEGVKADHIETLIADDVIGVRDNPLAAVRCKKNSSIVRGVRLLQEGHIDALVSVGNTGALIASATLFLRLFEGMERAALLATLPTISGSVTVVDIGAHISTKPRHLVQFAQLGAAFQQASEGVERPRVALLNIGTEELKGTEEARAAFAALQTYAQEYDLFEFVGNIEGKDVFCGWADVLVSDGFTGNVFLKTAEGMSSFIMDYLTEAFDAPVNDGVQRALATMRRRVSYAEYPGAIVCGVKGIVVKCHGYSCAKAICNGIMGAARLAQRGIIDRMQQLLGESAELHARSHDGC